MNALGRAWRGLFDEQRDAWVLGLLRLAISALLFFNGLRLIIELSRDGYFADYFHMPLLPEAWVPGRSEYQLLLGAQALASMFAFVGMWPREALLTAASLGLYILLC